VLTDLYRLLPPEGVKILLVLFLAFLTGLEREERRTDTGQVSFGGVRTYPLIGLIAYGVSFLAGGEILPVILGFAVVAGFLMLSYRNKLQSAGSAGVTSEMSALTTYLSAAGSEDRDFVSKFHFKEVPVYTSALPRPLIKILELFCTCFCGRIVVSCACTVSSTRPTRRGHWIPNG
jgi:hypothetical protein